MPDRLENRRPVVLTGDRPTGRLHLGHYVGSLINRVRLQESHACWFIIADYQVLGDHLDRAHEVADNVRQIAIDWMSVGLDPDRSRFFIQSQVAPLSELTMYFSMLVSVARCQRNPTIKAELQERARQSALSYEDLREQMSYGFLGYPVSQAADILLFKAHQVPVGEDQKAHIEQTREIARDFNRLFGGGREIFPVPEALIGDTPRLPGLDAAPPLDAEGFAIPRKMSKSLGNAIALSDPPDGVDQRIRAAFTDPTRLKKSDPGHPERCNIFAWYPAFLKECADTRRAECAEGRIGCVACKSQLSGAVNRRLDPIRERRREIESNPERVGAALREGTEAARAVGEATLREVRDAVGYGYRDLFSR